MKTNSLQTSQQTETKPAHTPTRQQTHFDVKDIADLHWLYRENELVITRPGLRPSIQLDKQIVRAVNSHASLVAINEELVVALSDALDTLLAIPPGDSRPVSWGCSVKQARAALAKAKA